MVFPFYLFSRLFKVNIFSSVSVTLPRFRIGRLLFCPCYVEIRIIVEHGACVITQQSYWTGDDDHMKQDGQCKRVPPSRLHSFFCNKSNTIDLLQATNMAPSARYESEKVDVAPLGKPLHFEFAGRDAPNRFLKGAMVNIYIHWYYLNSTPTDRLSDRALVFLGPREPRSSWCAIQEPHQCLQEMG